MRPRAAPDDDLSSRRHLDLRMPLLGAAAWVGAITGTLATGGALVAAAIVAVVVALGAGWLARHRRRLVAAVAGLATLAELRRPGAYERLFRTGNRLKAGLAAAARRHGLAAQVSGEAPVFDILFTDREIVDYRATLTADRDRIRRFNAECVRHGVVKAVNKIYVSLAHTDADVDETLEVFDRILADIAR